MTLTELNLQPDELRSLYLIHLRQLYSMECQEVGALPNLAVNVSTVALRQRLLFSATYTSEHVKMLETIFTELGEAPTGQFCEPMKTVINVGTNLLEEHPSGAARDLLLAGIAKEMKHLGIAKYAVAGTCAALLGHQHHGVGIARAREDEEVTDRELISPMLTIRRSKDTS